MSIALIKKKSQLVGLCQRKERSRHNTKLQREQESRGIGARGPEAAGKGRKL